VILWAKRIAIAAVVIAALFGLGELLELTVEEYGVRIIMLCGINAILAVGLNLVNGTTGQFSIGHAGFMAVGAYATSFTCISIEDAFFTNPEAGLGFFEGAAVFNASLLVGAFFAGLAGILVGVPSLRLRGDYLAIVTLGFGEVIRLIFNNSEALGRATGYSGAANMGEVLSFAEEYGPSRALGLPIYTSLFWVFLWVVLIVIVVRNLTFSTYGRALEAIREDEIASDAVGLPTTRLKVLAFVVSAATAGVGGGLFAHLQSTVRPDDFKVDVSINLIVMIILGGLGSITGAIVGAIVVTVSLELMREFGEYRLIVYPLVLVILMIVRPQGILGRWEFSPVTLLKRRRKAATESGPAKIDPSKPESPSEPKDLE
jgi:branched-chain amino acid transport system permease protein